MVLRLTVLTGFLGSGKTTLLKDYLQVPEAANNAVIVNEAGEIGLDATLIADGRDGLRIAMLANGCICCAQTGELATTIENLLASTDTPPARIILETSGLSRPGPILRSLQSLAFLQPRIDVLATYDCARATQSAGFDEAAAQWAGAQALILTRRDLGNPTQAATEAHSINPIAEIIDHPDRTTLLRTAFRPRPPAPPAEPTPNRPAHPRITTFLLRPTTPHSWHDTATWLDNLAGQLGDRLLRVKGLLPTTDNPHPILIQAVGTLFSAPRPVPPTTTFLVVIARDTTQTELAAIQPTLNLTIHQPNNPFTPRPPKLLQATTP